MAIEYSPPGTSAETTHRIDHITKFAGELWYVDGTDGDDANNGTGPHDAFATVGAAIAAAAAGDAITVKAGTYDEAGLDLSKEALQLWCEQGVTFNNTTPGTVLVISADYCLVRGLRVRQAGQVGFHVTGSRCVFEDCRAGPGVGTGWDVDAGSALLRDCYTGQATVTAFDVGANGFKAIGCHATGGGGATRGFYVRSGVRGHFLYCTSIDNETAGFETVAGANDHLFFDCASGGTDGDRVDAGERNFWPGFIDRMRREECELAYPASDGQGTAGDPIAVDNVATDDTPDTRSDQDYWGDVKRIIPVSVLTDPWYSIGLEIFATTANDVQQWQIFFPCPGCSSARSGGNAWDLGETALTVADGSLFQTDDLVWIASTSDPDGEILEVVSVVGGLVTIQSETRASGNLGVRYNHAGGERMYLVYRLTDRRYHDIEGDFSAGSAKDFARFLWHAQRRLHEDTGLIMRVLNATDGLDSGFDVKALYKD